MKIRLLTVVAMLAASQTGAYTGASAAELTFRPETDGVGIVSEDIEISPVLGRLRLAALSVEPPSAFVIAPQAVLSPRAAFELYAAAGGTTYPLGAITRGDRINGGPLVALFDDGVRVEFRSGEIFQFLTAADGESAEVVVTPLPPAAVFFVVGVAGAAFASKRRNSRA